MRKAETASKKALLLPLIPALALGIVAVVKQLDTPPAIGPAAISTYQHQPVVIVHVEQPPLIVQEPEPCTACVASF